MYNREAILIVSRKKVLTNFGKKLSAFSKVKFEYFYQCDLIFMEWSNLILNLIKKGGKKRSFVMNSTKALDIFKTVQKGTKFLSKKSFGGEKTFISSIFFLRDRKKRFPSV
jgi:hypothetical protein